jgi:hypothetical protein
VATWWGNLYDASPALREQMVTDLRNSPKANLNPITGEPVPAAKRRRRRKTNAKSAAPSE